MNFPKGLLAALMFTSCAVAVAGPQKTTPAKPSFSQASRDAFFARTEPLVGDLVVAPALSSNAKRYNRKSNRSSTRRNSTTKRRGSNSSSSADSPAAAQMKRENCQLMKQMARTQFRDGGVVAVDSSGKDFILRGARAEAVIAKHKKDIARWCN